MTYEYEVTMLRPDNDAKITRKLFPNRRIHALSVRQLAGYLTHTIFGDYERGGAGTLYIVRERITNMGDNLFVIERQNDGTYQRV